jgi:hypothetical protein
MEIHEKRWWKELRSHVRSVMWSRVALMVTSGVALPILECAFVNLLTGGPSEVKGWALGGLCITATLHFILVVLLVGGEITNPATNMLDAIQLEEDLERARDELKRRSNTSQMIRCAFDTLNLQACRMVGNRPEPIDQGLHPIMQQLACGLAAALGVKSAEFTIEVYFRADATSEPFMGGEPKVQAYFLSPRQIDPTLPLRLGDRAPVEWGWGRNRPGQCTIEDDKERFFEGGKPFPNLYFFRFATVPIHYVCSTEQCGLLVITSMQTEPFADDVLDTMQFVASIITQHLASHNRCFDEWITGLGRSLPRLHATLLADPHSKPKQVELIFREDVRMWEGGGLKISFDCLYFDGMAFPIQWSDPLSISITHGHKRVTITA